MNVLIVTTEYGEKAGGLALSCKKTTEIIQGFCENVFVEKVDGSPLDMIIDGGYDKTLRQKFSDAYKVDYIINKYKNFNIDYVLSYGAGKNATTSTIISKKLGAKLVIVLCGTDINLSMYSSELMTMNRFAFENAYAVIAKSNEMLKTAKTLYNNSMCKYILIPNFYEKTEIPKFKVLDSSCVSFATGAKYLNEKKGIYALLRGFVKYLCKYNRNDKLFLFGNVDEDLLVQYKKYLIKNNVEQNIIFEGDLKRLDYKKRLEQIDVYIQSSFYEGCPNSIIEAVDSGEFILTSDTGFFAEKLRDSFPESIITDLNEDNLADCIYDYISWISKNDNRNKIYELFHSITTKERIEQLWRDVFKIDSIPCKLFGRDLNAVMFHDINNRFSGVDYPLKAFEELALLVKSKGYKYVSMRDYIQARNKENLIVCTFDDAYESVYYNAYPVLKKLGFSATIFVNTDLIGQSNDWNTKDEVVRIHATMDMLRVMNSDGMEIGSHSMKHICLTRLSQTQLEESLCKSRELLEREFGRVSTFCYPYGVFNNYVKNQVAKYYDYAFSVDIGCCNLENDRYCLVRMVPEELKKRLKE